MYEFHDKLPINDSLVHGFVVARDDNGGIIFKKSNMVVNGGRESIIALIKNTIFNTTDGKAFKTFSSVKFGSNYSMTTPDTDGITEIGNPVAYQYDISTIREEKKAYCEYDVSNKRFKISIDVEANTPAEIRELGLYFKNISDDDNTEHLFSRVVFDPIFCGANAAISKFTMTYYVYL
jgi:hypothetical protein